MRTLLVMAVLAVPVWSSAQDQTAESSDLQAQRIYSLGEDAFANERFTEAAAYFERAFEISERPELLFNVGASYQRAGDVDAAVRAFEKYLELAPESEQREEVEVRLRVLRMEASPSEDSPPSRPLPPADSDPGAPTGGIALVIAGASAVVAGTALLFVAGGKRANVEDVRPEDGLFWQDVESDANSARTFGIVGGISLGVGAALTALGVILWARHGSDTEPDIALRGSLGGAVLEGQW